MVWLPPAYKANGIVEQQVTILMIYLIWEEFDQKGEFLQIWDLRVMDTLSMRFVKRGGAIVDIVLNHKAGGDEKRRFKLIQSRPNNSTGFDGGFRIKLPVRLQGIHRISDAIPFKGCALSRSGIHRCEPGDG